MEILLISAAVIILILRIIRNNIFQKADPNVVRSDYELLCILQKGVNSIYFEKGLCALLRALVKNNFINYTEYYKLEDLIFDNNDSLNTRKPYWWKPGKRKPRIKYIKYLKEITKNKLVLVNKEVV